MGWDRDVDMVVYIFDDRVEVWSRKGLRKHWWWKDKVQKGICRYSRSCYVCRPDDIYDFVTKIIEFAYRNNMSCKIIDCKTKEVVYVV